MGVAAGSARRERPCMLNCVHHVQWAVEAPGGLHQCLQCSQVVTRKDVTPRWEDLPEAFRRRWEEHEAARESAAAA